MVCRLLSFRCVFRLCVCVDLFICSAFRCWLLFTIVSVLYWSFHYCRSLLHADHVGVCCRMYVCIRTHIYIYIYIHMNLVI